jgi:photosystem II stability/assembly factor-like uncharacterized protein
MHPRSRAVFLLVVAVALCLAPDPVFSQQTGAQKKPGEQQKQQPAPKKTEQVEEQEADAPKPGGPPEEFKYLKLRMIGPAVGGRISRCCGVPGDPLMYYAATASGGVWKSVDGGLVWKSVFDEQPISSTGSIAVAPSDPNVVYVGSGEANIRGNVAAGNGIYKSTDAGKTWQHVWKQEGQIGTMAVHPTNPDIAYAAVLGHAFGPNEERGIYRTRDGGKTWQKVFYKDRESGASDVCFDPSNPRILFAGIWQAVRRPWQLVNGGPGSGLYTSRDGGDTWKQLKGKGLPLGIWGKVTVRVAPSDPSRIYAMIEAEKGGLYRSDDGGETWKLASSAHYIRQRPWYFSSLAIDPKNADIIWCPSVAMFKSIDAGVTFHKIKGFHHGDHHDLWIDPTNPRRMLAGMDGGIDISVDGGKNWYAPPLPLAQFYHVAADSHVPYRVSGTVQDFGTASGPSNSLCTSGIARGDWHEVGGGETGFTVPDPSDPDVVYAGEYGGYISKYNHRTRQAENVSIYPTTPSGHGGEDLRYRFQWTAPILVSPHDPKVLYHGANVLFRTTDGGWHWSAISPDLTRNDKSKQHWSGGPITGDNTGVEIYDTIFSIAESSKQKGLLWVGTDDGLVQLSRDDGKTWNNISKQVPGLPEWGTVVCIEPSPFEAGTAYVVVDAHRLDNTRPYLWKTTDFGQTWKNISAGLPNDVYLHAVREDPKHKGLLYVGTERGLAYSPDDGSTWKQLKLNLPTVAVHDLIVKGDDLVVGTHGRSVWILDDLTPIRLVSTQIAAEDVHLFPPEKATRYRYYSSFHAGKSVGENPPPGAIINYYLRAKPGTDISLEVLDAEGKPVAKLTSKAEKDAGKEDPDAPDEPHKKTVLHKEAGVNRAVWDLRYDAPEAIPGAKVDTGEPSQGPLVNPGAYNVRLTIEGQTRTASLTVEPDPRAQYKQPDWDEQLKFALTVRDDIARLAATVKRLRLVRKQLQARDELLKDQPEAREVLKLGQELSGKLDSLEARLHNPKAEATYDILEQRGGAKLYSILSALLNWVEESDGPPTQGLREVAAESAKELRQLEAEFQGLLSTDVARINEAARKLDVPNIIVPSSGRPTVQAK